MHKWNQFLKNNVHIFSYIRFFSNWWKIYAHKYGMLQMPFQMRARKGVSFWVRTKEDLGIMFEVFIGEVYTSHLSIHPHDTVIDIGGHEGIFSLYAASRQAVVYTYEPDPYNFEWLQKNKKLNPSLDIRAQQYACFEKSGKKNLFLREKSSRGGNSFFIHDVHHESILVQCTTLEDIIQTHEIAKVHFLKIDCEGSEFSILRTLPDAIFEKIFQIAVEVHSGPAFGDGSVHEIIQILESHGFFIQAHIFLTDEFSIIQATKKSI